MKRVLWTPEQDAKLKELRALGLTFVEIAERMGFTKGKIAGRVLRLRERESWAA